MAGMIPTISSGVAGPLGVLHLPDSGRKCFWIPRGSCMKIIRHAAQASIKWC